MTLIVDNSKKEKTLKYPMALGCGEVNWSFEKGVDWSGKGGGGASPYKEDKGTILRIQVRRKFLLMEKTFQKTEASSEMFGDGNIFERRRK